MFSLLRTCKQIADTWSGLYDLSFFQKYAEKKVAVACSGGADSVALLLWAVGHWGADRVVVLHFNHRTRDQENTVDLNFVQELVDRLGIKNFISESAEKDMQNANEEALRIERIKFFKKSLSILGIQLLLQGHHGDDKIESFLMRLSRGANMRSLLTPKKISEQQGFTIFRPFLGVDHQQIIDLLKKYHVEWREDQSNQSGKYYRNRVRHQLLPLWNKLSPSPLKPTLNRTMHLLTEDSEALEGVTDHAWEKCFDRNQYLLIDQLRNHPVAIRRRLIERFMALHGLGDFYSSSVSNGILEAIADNKDFNFQLTKEYFVQGSKNLCQVVFIEGKTEVRYSFSVPLETNLYLPDGVLSSAIVSLNDEQLNNIVSGKVNPVSEAYISLKNLEGLLEVRNWEQGDQFLPLGAPGRKKLQDWFTDYKISKTERQTLPLICACEIIWVPGFAPAQDYCLQGDDEKQALRLTYTRY